MSVGAAVALLGFALAAASFRLFRKGLLSFRYFLGWVAVGAALLSSALGFLLVGVPTRTELAIAGFLFAALLLALLVQLSISVSGLQRQLRDVAEAVALHSANGAHQVEVAERRENREGTTTGASPPE